jgi:polysaccharide pyruvyl transferase WcaK-like protein
MTERVDVFVGRPVRANRGDLASQAGLVAGILRHPGVHRVGVSTYYPHHYEDDRVVPLAPPPVSGLLTTRHEGRLLAGGTPVLWGGGVDLQDTGSRIKIPATATRLLLLKRRRSPVVVACQGAGPVTTRSGRIASRTLLRLVDRAVVREPTAQRFFEEAGYSRPIELAHDAALMLEPESPAFGRRYLEEKGLDPNAPTIAVNLRRWFHQTGSLVPRRATARDRGVEETEALVAAVADALREATALGYRQIVLLPMYRTEPQPWEDDAGLLDRMASRVGGEVSSCAVDEDLGVESMLSIIAATDIVVGVRLHSTILAHVAGVPAVHIAYEHKGVEHFAAMGMDDFVVPIETMVSGEGASILATRISEVHAERDTIRTGVQARRDELRAATEEAIHRSLDAVGVGRMDAA